MNPEFDGLLFPKLKYSRNKPCTDFIPLNKANFGTF